MKSILITGANSYIGTSFEKYMQQFDGYKIDTVDMIGEQWKKFNFSKYDTVFHVAGIAHSDVSNVSEETKDMYYKVNTDLAVETARKAKAEGVKQFIFMSSAIIYGNSAPIGKAKIIDSNTKPVPSNFYGDSKLQAENGILPLQDDCFNVVILRPPMIYGRGSKGNFQILSKLARKLPVFPYVNNSRSMLYVENLCEFVRLMIKNNENGIFHPQNSEYSNTTELVKLISIIHGKKLIVIKGFGFFLKILSCFSGLVNKAFGSLCYDMDLSRYKEDYIVCPLKESLERTEVK